MVLKDGDRMNMHWQVVVLDADNDSRKYVYHGGAFVDVMQDDECIGTFAVYDFTNGKRTVESIQDLLAAIERKMYATKGKD